MAHSDDVTTTFRLETAAIWRFLRFRR